MAWNPGDILTLTKGVSAAIGFIRQAVTGGLSANATIRALRESGFQVQRKNALEAHKAMKYAMQDPLTYMPVERDRKPNPDLVPLAVVEQNRAYRHTAWIDYYDSAIQDIVREHVTIDEDYLMTYDEFYLFTGQYAAKYGSTEREVLDFDIESVTYSDSPRNVLS